MLAMASVGARYGVEDYLTFLSELHWGKEYRIVFCSVEFKVFCTHWLRLHGSI